MKESKYKSWLWPAHIIRLREAARLRQEHNQLLNSHAELLEALEWFQEFTAEHPEWTETFLAYHDSPEREWFNEVNRVIAKARGCE